MIYEQILKIVEKYLVNITASEGLTKSLESKNNNNYYFYPVQVKYLTNPEIFLISKY